MPHPRVATRRKERNNHDAPVGSDDPIATRTRRVATPEDGWAARSGPAANLIPGPSYHPRASCCSLQYTFRVRRKSRLTDATQRAVSGARLATLAVVSGALATAVTVLAVAYAAAVGSSTPKARSDATQLASHREPAFTPLASLVGQSPDGSLVPSRERRLGDIVVVDVAPYVLSLDDELDRQRTFADLSGERMLLWLVVPDCKPCAAIESALSHQDMQRALANFRIIRLNAGDFSSELGRVGLPTDSFPGFALLGPNGRASDYLNGGEWDADVPQNIAPVLKSFVDGTYVHRRSPWHGGPHTDETPI